MPPPDATHRAPRSNYRACVRAHKSALSAQRALWTVMLHDTIQFKALQSSFATMNAVRGHVRLGPGCQNPLPSACGAQGVTPSAGKLAPLEWIWGSAFPPPHFMLALGARLARTPQAEGRAAVVYRK